MGSKEYFTGKKDFSWNPSICICENSRYLKSSVDNSVVVCGAFISITDSASTRLILYQQMSQLLRQ